MIGRWISINYLGWIWYPGELHCNFIFFKCLPISIEFFHEVIIFNEIRFSHLIYDFWYHYSDYYYTNTFHESVHCRTKTTLLNEHPLFLSEWLVWLLWRVAWLAVIFQLSFFLFFSVLNLLTPFWNAIACVFSLPTSNVLI